MLDVDIAMQLLIKVLNTQHRPTSNWSIKLSQHLRIGLKDSSREEKYRDSEKASNLFLDAVKVIVLYLISVCSIRC